MPQRLTESSSIFYYESFNNSPIVDDGKSIADVNSYLDKGYRIDYQAHDPQTKTRIAELIGNRETQEDRIAVGEVGRFVLLNEESRLHVLQSTIQDLQNSIDPTQHSGSTLCATVLCGATLYTVNVGDSLSFLVTRDNEKKIKFVQLNSKLHNITSKNVGKLRKQGIKIGKDAYGTYRLLNSVGLPSINMFRAMGDNEYEQSGMSHQPDIYVTSVKIPSGGDAFVIGACDGLTESLSNKQIRYLLSKYNKVSHKQLAEILAVTAYNKGSGDNITVIITPVEALSATKYIAIFDGHGGYQIAKHLHENFHLVFLKNLEKCLKS